jgi:predicted ATPase
VLAGATWGNSFHLGTVAQFTETDEGIELVDESLRQQAATGVRWFAPELYRIKGELLWRRGNADCAESHFARAIDEAGRQGARHWELRAATSLARLWREQSKPGEARELLAPIHAGFTEGSDIRDLQHARALLGELERRAALA